MSNHTSYRDLTKDERRRFGWFLFRENREPLRPHYPNGFWKYYEGNIEGMEYFSCPILYPDYFEDGDLIRILIADEEWDFPSVFWWFKQKRDGTFERLTPQNVSEEYGHLYCLCGNNSTKHRFYPCNEIGSEVTEKENWEKGREWYACDTCGRIINYVTCEVLGFRQPNYTR